MGGDGRQRATMDDDGGGGSERRVFGKQTHSRTNTCVPKWVGEGFRRAFRVIHIHEFTVYAKACLV